MDYAYDAIPAEDVRELPAAVHEAAVVELQSILASGKHDAIDVRAGFIYERKDATSVDYLGGPRNSSYGHASDDVLLQVTVRVPGSRVKELIAKAAVAQEAEDEAARLEALAAKEREREAIDLEIEALKAKRASI